MTFCECWLAHTILICVGDRGDFERQKPFTRTYKGFFVFGKWLEKPPTVRTRKLMCVDEAGDGLQKLKPRRHTRMKE